MAKCQVCYRKTKSVGLCRYHQIAYEKLKQNYEIWCDVYGKLSWEEYLERLMKNKAVGLWVKDLIKLEK